LFEFSCSRVRFDKIRSKLAATATMAKDLFHQAVKRALIKDGWTVTHDPLIIRIDRIKLEIDLAAEKVLAAEKDGQKVAVEVKSQTKNSSSLLKAKVS